MKLPATIQKLTAKLKPTRKKEPESAFEVLEDNVVPAAKAAPAHPGLAAFSIDPKGFFCRSAVWLLGESVLFRLLGSFGLWEDSFFVYTQLLLPVLTCLLFIALLLALGSRFVWPTIVPVIFGTVFFIIRIWSATDSFPMVHIILCTLLYVLILIVWTLTMIGLIRSKWYLVPLFGLPFLYHIFIEDYPLLKAGTLGFGDGMQEMSVLFIMLAMLSIALGLKKTNGDDPGPQLPPIKDPTVWIKPKNTEAAGDENKSEENISENKSEENKNKENKSDETSPASQKPEESAHADDVNP